MFVHLYFCFTSIEGPPSKTLSNIGGLHCMLGLPDHILVATAGEPIESLPSSEASNKFGASFETPSGRKLVGCCNPFIFNFTHAYTGICI
jgi:queuine tRNA-ribosyltransferase subunit QTRTD1